MRFALIADDRMRNYRNDACMILWCLTACGFTARRCMRAGMHACILRCMTACGITATKYICMHTFYNYILRCMTACGFTARMSRVTLSYCGA